MPPPRPPLEFLDQKDVLDLGCSIGRWLWEYQPKAKTVAGLEIRREYIELGHALARRENFPLPPMVHGCIEKVDEYFEPESKDFILCRLAINHVSIRKTLQKIEKVLRPGGRLWLEVESFRCGWEKLRVARGAKAKVFAGFGIANSGLCEVTGSQMNFPYQGRHQSAHKAAYPSRRWWSSTFRKLGLESHFIESAGESFCIWGRKA
jgi:SAM-dependent methyltransferase